MSQLKVLLIENSATYRRMIVSIGQDKAEFVECDNLQDGQRALSAQRFDLILLGLHLPEGNTIEFCREFYAQQAHRETVTVFLSAEQNLEWRLRAYEAGAEDFILKNLKAVDLGIKLEGLFNYHRKHLKAISELKQQAHALINESYTVQVDNNAFTHFFRSCRKASNIEQFGPKLESLFAHWGFNFTARVVDEDGNYQYLSNLDDLICPIEKTLFEELSEGGSKVQSFGSRSFFQFGQVSLIVKNMPTDDDKAHGRLIDLFHIVAEVMNSRREELAVIAKITATQQKLQVMGTGNPELEVVAAELQLHLLELCNSAAEESAPEEDEITFF